MGLLRSTPCLWLVQVEWVQGYMLRPGRGHWLSAKLLPSIPTPALPRHALVSPNLFPLCLRLLPMPTYRQWHWLGPPVVHRVTRHLCWWLCCACRHCTAAPIAQNSFHQYMGRVEGSNTLFLDASPFQTIFSKSSFGLGLGLPPPSP